MLRNPVAPSSPAAALGRRRTVNHDLPPRMARKGDYYYYVSKEKVWAPLGNDRARALRLWSELYAAEEGLVVGKTVGELIQDHMDVMASEWAAGTMKQYRSFHRTLSEAFPIPAKAMTSQALATWRDLPKQLARKEYVNGCISLLQGAFRRGHEKGLCSLISVVKWPGKVREHDMTPAEFLALREWEGNPSWLPIAMDLDYLTAARPCDVLALMWDKVGERLALRQKKTQQRQEFVITPELAAVLDRARWRPILGLYVVANDKGRPIKKATLDYHWKKARKALGLLHVEWRDIRAMAAKAAKEGGQDYQALLGHASKRMSDRYIKGKSAIVVEPVRKKL